MATITSVSNKMIILPIFIDDYGDTIGIRLSFVNILSNMILKQQYHAFPTMWLRITYQDGSMVNEQEIKHVPYSSQHYDFTFYKEIHKVYIVMKEESKSSDVEDIVGISGEENERILLKQEMDFRGTIPVFMGEDAHWHLPTGSWRELAVKSNNPNIDFIPKVVVHVNHHVYYDCILRQIDNYIYRHGDKLNEVEIKKGCRAKLLCEWFDSFKDIYRRHVYESYPMVVYGTPHLSSKSISYDSFVLDTLDELDKEMFSNGNDEMLSFDDLVLTNIVWDTHDELKDSIRNTFSEFGTVERNGTTLILSLNKGVFDIHGVFDAYDFYDDVFTYLMEEKGIRKLVMISSGRGNGVKYTMVKGDKMIEVVKTVCMTARITNDKHDIHMDDNWLVTDKFDMQITTEKGNGYELLEDGKIVASTRRVLKNEMIGKINNAIKLRKRRQ
jgi:hypothetical protein